MMRTRKAYEIRAWGNPYSVGLGSKLYARKRALRLVRYLQKRGVDAFMSPILVAISAKPAA